jgi:murein DD-endopeptidase MepM/ murein hydrolase activator NlpD
MAFRRWAALLAAGLAIFVATPASADTASDLSAAQARQKVIAQVRSELSDQLATALQTQDQLAQAMKDNSDQQAKLQSDIAASDARIAQLTDEIAALQADEDRTQARIDDERAQIRSLARAIYVQPSSYLLLFTESSSVGDLITRVNDIRSAGDRADAMKVQLNADLKRLDAEEKKEQADLDQQQKLRAQQAADLARLQDLRAKQEKAQADLEKQIAATRSELALLQTQSTQLAQAITDLLEQQEEQVIAAAYEAVWSSVQGAGTPAVPTGISKNHSTKYPFVWPEVTGTETQPFGPSAYWFEPPFYGYAHFHTGIDMSQGLGSQVRAADDGLVIEAGGSYSGGQLVGYGNYIILAHLAADGTLLETLYGHLSAIGVKKGDNVVQGQVIGLEGSTGNSTGSHLHFELRKGGQPIDPAPFLPPNGPNDFRA